MVVDELRYRLDVNTLHRDLEATELGAQRHRPRQAAHDLAAGRRPVPPQPRDRSFILIDEATNNTVGGGHDPRHADRVDRGAAAASPRASSGSARRSTRERRDELLGRRGATVWFTGLPASGKSTMARGARPSRWSSRGVPAYRLDGDNLRHGLCGDLGFDHESREENIRRAAEVARLMADAGIVTVVSLVSPYRASARRRAARCTSDDGLPFLEVWVSTPLEECERRDPKGLYARARRGEVAHMTGVDDPYEEPENAGDRGRAWTASLRRRDRSASSTRSQRRGVAVRS